MQLTSFITSNLIWGFIFWLWFALGQALFIFVRASWAVRLNKAPTQWFFVSHNKSTIFIRALLEFVFFYMYRNATPEQLSSILHFNFPFKLPQAALMYVALGLISDFLLDQFSSVPVPGWGPQWFQAFLLKLKTWVAENIPPPPDVVVALKQEIKDNADSGN